MKGLNVILAGCLFTAAPLSITELRSPGGHAAEIELRQLFTIGGETGTDGVFFGNIGSLVAVDDAGRIFVGERQSPKIYAFTNEGELIRQIGQEGEAPGEFRSLQAIHTGPGDTLYTFDSLLRKVSAFAPSSLELAYTFAVSNDSMGNYPSAFSGAIDGGFVVVFEEPGTDSTRSVHAKIIDWEGGVIQDPSLRLPAIEWVTLRGPFREMGTHMPFGRYPFFRLGPAEQIYAGSSGAIDVAIVTANGMSRGSITHPHRGAPVTSRDIDEYVKNYSGDLPNQIRKAMRYESRPAYSTFHVDDKGWIWVQLTSVDAEAEISRWLVLNAESRVVGELTLPASTIIQAVTADRAYATEDGFILVVYEISET